MNLVIGRRLADVAVGLRSEGSPADDPGGAGGRFLFLAPQAAQHAAGHLVRRRRRERDAEAVSTAAPSASWPSSIAPVRASALSAADIVGRQWGRLPLKAGLERGAADDAGGAAASGGPGAGGPANLLTVEAVKYTTARAVAEQVVDRVVAALGLPPRPCRTAETPLVGAGPQPPPAGAGGAPPPRCRRRNGGHIGRRAPAHRARRSGRAGSGGREARVPDRERGPGVGRRPPCRGRSVGAAGGGGVKILVLAPHPFYQARGTPIAVRTVLEFLSGRGDTVDVLTYPEGTDVDIPNCTVHRVPRLPGLRNIRAGFSAKKLVCDGLMVVACTRLVRRNRYDLIHAVEESVFIANAMRAISDMPYVYDMDSSLAEQLVESRPDLRDRDAAAQATRKPRGPAKHRRARRLRGAGGDRAGTRPESVRGTGRGHDAALRRAAGRKARLGPSAGVREGAHRDVRGQPGALPGHRPAAGGIRPHPDSRARRQAGDRRRPGAGHRGLSRAGRAARHRPAVIFLGPRPLALARRPAAAGGRGGVAPAQGAQHADEDLFLSRLRRGRAGDSPANAHPGARRSHLAPGRSRARPLGEGWRASSRTASCAPAWPHERRNTCSGSTRPKRPGGSSRRSTTKRSAGYGRCGRETALDLADRADRGRSGTLRRGLRRGQPGAGPGDAHRRVRALHPGRRGGERGLPAGPGRCGRRSQSPTPGGRPAPVASYSPIHRPRRPRGGRGRPRSPTRLRLPSPS